MNGNLMVFETGGERIALPLDHVAEVLEEPSWYPLPLVPSFLGRAVSAKGAPVPVLDLGTFLGRNFPSSWRKVMVMAVEGANLALQIDRVVEIIPGEDLGDQQAADKPFSALVKTSCGEVLLLSPGNLLGMLERVLAGGGSR